MSKEFEFSPEIRPIGSGFSFSKSAQLYCLKPETTDSLFLHIAFKRLYLVRELKMNRNIFNVNEFNVIGLSMHIDMCKF
jgi:hypothetical protein